MKSKHYIKILLKNDYYKILDNDSLISFFLQRKPGQISYFNINDQVKDFVFKTI